MSNLSAQPVLADVLRDLSRWFNYAEVAIWPIIGLVLLIASFWKSGAIRRDFRLAALVLFAFGPTDFVEAAYGNKWWEPWWLLVWKVACVVALAAILFNAWKLERKLKAAPVTAPDTEPTGRV